MASDDCIKFHNLRMVTGAGYGDTRAIGSFCAKVHSAANSKVLKITPKQSFYTNNAGWNVSDNNTNYPCISCSARDRIALYAYMAPTGQNVSGSIGVKGIYCYGKNGWNQLYYNYTTQIVFVLADYLELYRTSTYADKLIDGYFTVSCIVT